MDTKNGFCITNRDRLLRAWQDSTELVRKYQEYADEINDDDSKLTDIFYKYAEDEGRHASKLLELLRQYDEGK